MTHDGRRPVSLIVTGGHVLTLNAADPEYPDGAIAIDGDSIVGVGTRTGIEAAFVAREVIDATGTVIMPGLVDAYAHAGHGMVRGLWHPVGGAVGDLYFTGTTPDWWRADADLAALERLKAGVTTGQSVIGATPARSDDPVFADVTAQAYASAGLRLSLAVGPPDPVFPHLPEPFTGTHPVAGRLEPRVFTASQALAHSIDVISRWNGAAEGRIQAMLHPPYLFGRHVVHRRTPQRLPDAADAPMILAHARDMRRVADDLGVAIHTHMFAGSVAYMLAHFGRAEVDRLLDGPLVVAHANGLSDEEVAVLGASGAGIATVAFTHENLWYGVAPIRALRGAGCAVAIATDGAATYASYDLWREPARAAWNQWGAEGTQRIMPPETLIGMMTIEAAAVLGQAERIGSLEVGKKADLICVDLRQPHIGAVHDLAQTLVLYATASDVRDVVVDGRILMRNRQALLVDEAEILSRARHESQAALARRNLDPIRRTDAWTRPGVWPRGIGC
jgi:cytosine/adenosine deaminase-related metal-dependent hydrolase